MRSYGVKKILIDTNAYSDLIRGNEKIQVILDENKVYIPLIVIAELRPGFQFGSRKDQNEQILKAFLEKVEIITLNLETTAEYAKIYANLRNAGNPIPTNDIWIAALCKQHELPLLTFDAHFRFVDGLEVINPLEN
jgi:predicted nucleic acid-binding protein/ADP-ribose pyrophosphatase YjhB (NUDIX family)